MQKMRKMKQISDTTKETLTKQGESETMVTEQSLNAKNAEFW